MATKGTKDKGNYFKCRPAFGIRMYGFWSRQVSWLACCGDDGNQAVFCHKGVEFVSVGGAAGVDDGGRFLKEIRAKQRGCDDRQRFDCALFQVVETMNGAAWNKAKFSRGDVHGSSLDREGQSAFHPVNGLVVMLVEVR